MPSDVRVHRVYQVFEDGFAAITRLWPEDHSKRFVTRFEGEDVLNCGGVSREWFFLLSHETFNPSYGLFGYSAHDNYTLQLQINLSFGVNPEHLGHFKCIGRVHGLAIFHHRSLSEYFVPGFYKMVLNKEILKDLEAVSRTMALPGCQRYNGCGRRDVLPDRRPLWRAPRHRAQAGPRYTRRGGGEPRGVRCDTLDRRADCGAVPRVHGGARGRTSARPAARA
ncbi:hypothetical protein BJY52DRAFT_315729 [Lactarius psammicola]|nr:hypothetical protein BJY52DRAFT_315729 [Lactarius psammicola]